jgi:type IV pilus assembly protein PilF
MTKDTPEANTKQSSDKRKVLTITAVTALVFLVSLILFMLVVPSFVDGINAADSVMWNNKFNYYLHLKEWENLYNTSMEAIEKDSELASAYYFAATASDSMGYVERAADLYKKAIEIAPTNGGFYFSYGEIQKRMNNLDEAEEYLLKGLPLAPEEYKFLFNYNLGWIYYDNSILDKAEYYFKEADKLQPNDNTVLQNLGSIALRQGKPKEAIPYLEQVLKNYRRNRESLYLLIEAYLKEDKIRDAANAWKKYRGPNPIVLKELTNWGNEKLRDGEPEMARKVFEAVLIVNPKDNSAKRGMDRIQNYFHKKPENR